MNNQPTINFDLYERYISRMDGNPTVNDKQFYVCLRVLLACDVIHDFIKPRGEPGRKLWAAYLGSSATGWTNYKDYFLQANAKRIVEDCGGVKSELITFLSIPAARFVPDTDLYQPLINLFSSEEIAKNTADWILGILGLTEQNVQSAMVRNNPCDNFSVLDLIKSLDLVKSSGKSHIPGTNYNIIIDATSDKTNLTPFYGELMNRAYKKLNNCREENQINILNTLATKYDSSNVDALTKIFTSLGLTQEINDNLFFNINCGGLNMFQGELTTDIYGRPSLAVGSYFGASVAKARGAGSDVNGITEDMLKLYNARPRLHDELLNLTIFKTMGDFLQIMTHLQFSTRRDYQKDINVFITFDSLCAKIAGVLDKNVFYEKKFISDADKISGGLYTFFTETARDERTSALGLIDMSVAPRGPESARWLVDDVEMSDWLPPLYNFVSPAQDSRPPKRSRTNFGKKKPKVKNLPNKALMTKLKSVGIKITKKRGKRRVYLSRSELIKKATAFKNLQIRAKKLKVRIMYKNKKGKYVYKTVKRLTNDIKRQISKMKKSAKKPAKKQIKQRFG